ncbi:DUF6017 domain-containing protein [Ruminococcaceae bacterium OttesenSCG-928-D13]|nr:DUF6017 domain-containing protein [Ruminococcaceae bacterium OttesenSCG-928-D13]
MAVFRVEKTRDFTVMSNHHLRNQDLSLKAKGLLSLMLSLPEDWDYTLAGLAHICLEGLSSIRAAINELEAHGYLRRQRLRNDKGQLTDTEYTILEKPDPPASEPICDNRTQASPPAFDFQTLDNPTLGFPTQGKPTLGNRMQLNTNPPSTEIVKTDGVIIHPINPVDSMDELATVYRQVIQDNIEYGILAGRHGEERVDEVVELMLEVVLSHRPFIRIAGDDFPREVVKNRMLKLNSQHVEYVFDAIDENTTKVRNVKAYLLTALYNAPATMDTYYRTAVSHDLYGGGTA